MPTADNTRVVAQAHAPESAIVYVDDDPLVLVHADALLASAPEGGTGYRHADLRDSAAGRPAAYGIGAPAPAVSACGAVRTP